MTPIPNNAPFTPQQAAGLNSLLPTMTAEQMRWLGGFFAGYAYATSGAAGAVPAGVPAAAAAPAEKVPVTVLYGTESGNAEALADKARKELGKRGFKVSLKDMGDIEPKALEKTENLLVIVSTWGEGDPPERAAAFYQKFMENGGANLKGTRFSVCGLGDTSYAEFCKMGKDFDARLESLGGVRISPRADCDVDFEPEFQKWFDGVVKEFETSAAPTPTPGIEVLGGPAIAAPAEPAVAWSKSNPFHAELVERINLNGTGSAKETCHLEFSLEGSGLTYLPGDSLGVKPRNCPEVIGHLLQASNLSGDEEVNRADGSAGPLRDILCEELDSTTLSRNLVKKYAEVTKLEKLAPMLADMEGLRRYCEGRQIVDLFSEHPAKDLSPQQLAEILRVLPPRLYSIASSLRAHPEQVHLTVGIVRYKTHGRSRKGVASTYLADRVEVGQKVPVYVHANNRFRLPEDPDRPIIMVGPGTGIAPFRSFVEERAATGAKGKNWLFFGDQHFTYDFLYQLEWQDYLKEGVLTRMDVAFSRDAPEKVYVQHRMREHGREIYKWLEEGAHFYVCGDALRMAKDVNDTLQDIVAEHGGLKPDDAKEYLTRLTKDKRYQRDVY